MVKYQRMYHPRWRMHTRQCLELILRLLVQQFIRVLHPREVRIPISTWFDDVHGEVCEQLLFKWTVMVPLWAWAVDADPVVVGQSEYVRVRGLGVHAVGGVDCSTAEQFGGLDLLFGGQLALVSEYAYAELLGLSV